MPSISLAPLQVAPPWQALFMGPFMELEPWPGLGCVRGYLQLLLALLIAFGFRGC